MLLPEALIAPTGELQEGFFPDGNLLTYANEWLVQGYTQATVAQISDTYRDFAAKSYAYYLAYRHVADRLAAEPNSVSVDAAASVSKSVGRDRIAYFQGLARQHLEDFHRYANVPQQAKPPGSTYTQTVVVF